MKFVRPTLVTAAAGLLLAGPMALVQASAAQCDLPSELSQFCPPGGSEPAPPAQDEPTSDDGSSDDETTSGGGDTAPAEYEYEDSTAPAPSGSGADPGAESAGTQSAGSQFVTPAQQEPEPPLQPICDGLKEGGAPPDLVSGCQQVVDNLKPPGDGGGLEDVDNALKPVTDIVCQVVAELNKTELKQLVEQLEPLAQGLEDAGAKNLANALRGLCGDGGDGDDGGDGGEGEQPRPETGGGLPKTGGVPMWLIPVGLLMISSGALMVLPTSVRTEI